MDNILDEIAENVQEADNETVKSLENEEVNSDNKVSVEDSIENEVDMNPIQLASVVVGLYAKAEKFLIEKLSKTDVDELSDSEKEQIIYALTDYLKTISIKSSPLMNLIIVVVGVEFGRILPIFIKKKAIE